MAQIKNLDKQSNCESNKNMAKCQPGIVEVSPQTSNNQSNFNCRKDIVS